MQFKVGTSSNFISGAVGTNVLQHQNQLHIKDIEAIGKPVVLLVDADIVAYRCSATTDGRSYAVDDKTFSYMKDAKAYCAKHDKSYDDIVQSFTPDPPIKAKKNVDKVLKSLKQTFKAHKMELYLTPEVLFRADYMSDYKQNRVGLRKPHNLKAAKEYCTDAYFAETVEGYEADDLLAIRCVQLMEEGKYTPIICSLDKDLDMISGYHYNWVKKAVYYITPEEGTLNFYTQLLMGDKTDNIPGLHNVGIKTAEKILDGLDGSSSYDCYNVVLKAYLERTPKEDDESDDAWKERVVTEITRNARLLYIVHRPAELWQPPVKIEGDNNE